jgi:thiosulfate dehydrogenase (quinone) large subunit
MATARMTLAPLPQTAAGGRAEVLAAAFAPGAWLFVRLVLGIEWLRAGIEKLGEPGWTASPQGGAVAGFLKGALAKTGGAHPEVQGWFTGLTEQALLPSSALLAHLVTYGEVLVGLALIAGLFTRFAAASGY